LKSRKINYACIASSILTARVNIEQITMCTLSGDTGSTKNSIQKSIKSFMKIEAN